MHFPKIRGDRVWLWQVGGMQPALESVPGPGCRRGGLGADRSDICLFFSGAWHAKKSIRKWAGKGRDWETLVFARAPVAGAAYGASLGAAASHPQW